MPAHMSFLAPAKGVLTASMALFPALAFPLAVPDDCDYLVLTDSLLLPEAERLAEMRADNASDHIAKPHVATMAEVYRDYPSPGPRSNSVLLFLRDVEEKNGRLPGHLLLFGDASFDDASPDNRVPSFIYSYPAPWRSSFSDSSMDTGSSDDVYAELADTLPRDTLRLRMAVGRIPAGTLAQARQYVDKVIAYESNFAYGPAAFTYGYVNDDDRQAGAPSELDPIVEMPNYHQSLWRNLAVKPFARRVLAIEFPLAPDYSKPAAKDSLFALFNAGPSRLYLIGHAGYTQFTDEKLILVPGDLSRLRAKPLAPIVALLSSNGASFAHRTAPSMGEELLFHPHGAIAFLGGVRATYPLPNNYLFKAWEDSAARGGTLGRTFRNAKTGGGAGWDAFNALGFALLGDPGLTLHVPAIDLVPAEGSGTSRLVLEGAGTQGDSAFFQVVQLDTVPYTMWTTNPYLADYVTERERIVGEGRAILGAGGSLAADLPRAPNPHAAFVKAMTWNSRGMRYGHFPLSDLGPIGVKGRPSRARPGAGPRLVLEGSRLRVEWTSKSGTRIRANLDGSRPGVP